MSLNELQMRLLGELENGIEICSRPFEPIARQLGITEKEAIEQAVSLKEQGYIRRFRGRLNYRRLGRLATLAAAKVPEDKLEAVAAAVNALAEVSHNYLRDHEFNLWFTLQGPSMAEMERTLSGLKDRTGAAFISLPAVKMFKLDVRFGQAGGIAPQVVEPANRTEEKADLTAEEKKAARLLQTELPLTPEPFARLAADWQEAKFLKAAGELRRKGVLRKIAAAADHYRLGYTTNAIFCAEVPEEFIEQVGLFLAKYRQVSHCYERRTAAGWPYNIYAMIHVHSEEILRTWVEELIRTVRISNYAILRTVKELKKEPVILDFS